MSIEIDESIVGIWYAALDGKSDFLMSVNTTDEGWKIIYRFRYYHSDDPFDQEDVKNWFSATVSNKNISEMGMIKSTNKLFALLKDKAKGPCTVLLRGEGTFEQFMDEFLELPFVHQKVFTKEEFKKEYPDTVA